MEILIKKLTPHAKVPTFAHNTDAGMDVYSSGDYVLQPMERTQIATGIALQLPNGFVALVWDKSSLSHKKGLKVLGGVLDSGYRGEIQIGVINLGTEPIVFTTGDKVAQILIQKVEHPTLVEVDTLDEADRGDNGFGSTGAK